MMINLWHELLRDLMETINQWRTGRGILWSTFVIMLLNDILLNGYTEMKKIRWLCWTGMCEMKPVLGLDDDNSVYISQKCW